LTLCRGLHAEALKVTVSEGLLKVPRWRAARAGFEPTTLRRERHRLYQSAAVMALPLTTADQVLNSTIIYNLGCVLLSGSIQDNGTKGPNKLQEDTFGRNDGDFLRLAGDTFARGIISLIQIHLAGYTIWRF